MWSGAGGLLKHQLKHQRGAPGGASLGRASARAAPLRDGKGPYVRGEEAERHAGHARGLLGLGAEAADAGARVLHIGALPGRVRLRREDLRRGSRPRRGRAPVRLAWPRRPAATSHGGSCPRSISPPGSRTCPPTTGRCSSCAPPGRSRGDLRRDRLFDVRPLPGGSRSSARTWLGTPACPMPFVAGSRSAR